MIRFSYFVHTRTVGYQNYNHYYSMYIYYLSLTLSTALYAYCRSIAVLSINFTKYATVQLSIITHIRDSLNILVIFHK